MQLDRRRPIATKRLLSRMTRVGSASSTRTLAKLRVSTKCLMTSRNARLVVEVGLEIGGVDGDEALRGGGDLVDGGAHFGERGEHVQGSPDRWRFALRRAVPESRIRAHSAHWRAAPERCSVRIPRI